VLANIPASQTVIEIKAPGGPDMLVPAIRPVPEPKAGEVLIRIAGSGVNRADSSTVPVPAGEVAVIWVSLATVTAVAAVVPKFTAVAPVNPLPVTVTLSPPAAAPLVGLSPVTVGVTAAGV
jgi:NADPH:quinone reductase-like Zn-dependent oxidoreductase